MAKKLRLFVWEGVLNDYSAGIMFALAHDEDEARRLVREASANSPSVVDDSEKKPDVYDAPRGFYLYGGA